MYLHLDYLVSKHTIQANDVSLFLLIEGLVSFVLNKGYVMFLKALQKQNPAFIEAAAQLMKSGKVLPDTYLIDIEQFRENARLIKIMADNNNIRLYAMTKQFGRNPILAKILTDELGYDGIVCVDFKEARHFQSLGIKIGHVGHLVQPPSSFIHSLINDIKPEVITVYSLEKARELSIAAVHAKRYQPILLKFYQEDDLTYSNQESGFLLRDLPKVFSTINNYPNLIIEGITHFPCFLFNSTTNKTEATHNLGTLQAAVEQALHLGYDIRQRNYPSGTSCETLPLIRQLGGSHGEPGHALTGTIPANQDGCQPEKIAMLYLTEVAHHFAGRSYCFGGGTYQRGMITGALALEPNNPHGRYIPLFDGDPDSIDYHVQLNGISPIGTPIVMAFRTQIFVTRSDVALVSGVAGGTPQIIGLFDSQGRTLQLQR